jgi:hypothetical protein
VRTSSGILSRIGGAVAVVGGLLWSAKAFYDRNDAPPWPTSLFSRCRCRSGASSHVVWRVPLTTLGAAPPHATTTPPCKAHERTVPTTRWRHLK